MSLDKIHSRGDSGFSLKLLILFLFGYFLLTNQAFTQTCNALCNTDFDDIQLAPLGGLTFPKNGKLPCWRTTASDSTMELWSSGFNGVTAYSGDQFIELNAYMYSTLYQNFFIAPGSTISIEFAHRGRAGVDTMSVSIGPVGGPYKVLGKYGTGTSSWKYYSTSYTVPAGGNYYSLRFTSVYTTSGIATVGNFLDAISVKFPGTGTLTTSATDVKCNGQNTGSATANIVGGISPYTYSWSSTGGTGAIASGLSAGSYTVLVTDAQGCKHTDVITITQPAGFSVSISGTVASCTGGATGSATAISTGGNSPYTYSWTGSVQTLSSITGLMAGSYSIVSTDVNGCSASSAFTISSVTGPTLATSVIAFVSCYQNADGSAFASPSGGATPYQYSWSSIPSQTSTSATGLASGTYSVAVTDFKGCSISKTVTITQPNAIVMNVSAPVNACNGILQDTIYVYSQGGTSPYTYSWSNGSTLPYAVGLAVGTYTVTVTDNNNCSKTTSTSVSVYVPLSVNINAVPVGCTSGSLGSATATVSGGNSPYSYSWTGSSQTTAGISGLSAGSYTLNVKDSNGCTSSLGYTINSVVGPSVTVSSTPVSCYQSTNGTASVNVTGGTSPFQYLWSTSPVQTTSAATGLAGGVYSVIVTDPNNCSLSLTTTVIEPTALAVTTSASNNPICVGQPTTLSVTPTGGTSAYSYSWINENNSSQQYIVSPITGNTYTVLVTDANNCVKSATIQIDVRDPLSISSTTAQNICQGENAVLHIAVNGGDGNYTYTWQPIGNTGNSISVSPNNTTTYTVIVNDGCGTPSQIKTVTVNVEQPPTLNPTVNNFQGCAPLCLTVNNSGTVSGSATYSWSMGDGNSTDIHTGQYCYTHAGDYMISLSVTDINGCKTISFIKDTIHVYSSPEANFTFSPTVITSLDPNVTFTSLSENAVPVLWSFGDGIQSITGDSIIEHKYSPMDESAKDVFLIVTNEYGCLDTVHLLLKYEKDWTVFIPNTITPNGDGKNDNFYIVANGITEFEIWIYDRWGNLVYECSEYSGNTISCVWNGKVQDGSSNETVQQDIYVYLIYFRGADLTPLSRFGHISVIK